MKSIEEINARKQIFLASIKSSAKDHTAEERALRSAIKTAINRIFP